MAYCVDFYAVNDGSCRWALNMDVVIFRWIMTIPKSLSSDALARLRICQKCVCGRGSAPDPVGEAHSAPRRSTTGFGGAASRRRGEWDWERKNGKGREERRGRGKQGRGGERPLRLHIPGSLFYPSPPLLRHNRVASFIASFCCSSLQIQYKQARLYHVNIQATRRKAFISDDVLFRAVHGLG